MQRRKIRINTQILNLLKDAVVITQSGSVQEALYNQYVPECKEFKLVSSMTDAYLGSS